MTTFNRNSIVQAIKNEVNAIAEKRSAAPAWPYDAAHLFGGIDHGHGGEVTVLLSPLSCDGGSSFPMGDGLVCRSLGPVPLRGAKQINSSIQAALDRLEGGDMSDIDFGVIGDETTPGMRKITYR